MNETALEPDAVLAPNPAVTVDRLVHEAIVHDRSSGRVHVVTGSAARLFELLDGVSTLDEVTMKFAQGYGMVPAAVRPDIEEIVQTFCELSLVRTVGDWD